MPRIIKPSEDTSPNEDRHKPGILMKLNDNENFTPSEIFSCMTSDVNSHAKLKSKLKEKYTKDAAVDSRFGKYSF